MRHAVVVDNVDCVVLTDVGSSSRLSDAAASKSYGGDIEYCDNIL